MGNQVRKYLDTRKKPDVVYAAVPPLKGAYDAAVYCEKKQVKFIVDVQDLWPEAYKMVFHVPVVSDLVFAPFSWIANGIYKRADAICGVSRTYAERAKRVNKKTQIIHPVFLGTDLSVFDMNVQENRIKRDDLGEVWLGYCGTLGASYDLNIVFDSLRIVDDYRIKLIIMGDGPRRQEFESNAVGLNVVFTGLLPYQEMCGLLSSCDIAVNPIMKGAAASIINKHGDYAAAGLPVINTQECPEYKELINKYRMGFNCDNSNPSDLAEKIKKLVFDVSLRKQMGRNARKCAEELFNRNNQYQVLVNVIVSKYNLPMKECCYGRK